MEKTLKRLGAFREVPLDRASPFVQPASIKYELDGERAGAVQSSGATRPPRGRLYVAARGGR
jgi:hypothetical protein